MDQFIWFDKQNTISSSCPKEELSFEFAPYWNQWIPASNFETLETLEKRFPQLESDYVIGKCKEKVASATRIVEKQEVKRRAENILRKTDAPKIPSIIHIVIDSVSRAR